MNNEIVLTAVALMLVLEGLLPFLLSDGQLRFIGLTAMLAGLLLLALVRGD